MVFNFSWSNIRTVWELSLGVNVYVASVNWSALGLPVISHSNFKFKGHWKGLVLFMF